MSRDPAIPLVTVHWYYTTAPFLPYPTVFNSLNWDATPERRGGLGEVFGTARDYHQEPPIPGLTGDHICGTQEMFINGRPLDYSGPIQEYDPDGIPLCCGREVVGFVESGAAVLALDQYVQSDAGNVISGAAVLALVSQITTDAGNVESGAQVNAVEQYIARGMGNVEGGAAVLALDQVIDADAGNVISGAAVLALVSQITTDAGNVESGAAVLALMSEVTTDAGNVESGAQVNALVSQITTDAGNVESGAQVNALVVPVTTDAGNVESGAQVNAVDQYIPAAVSPGTTCASAGTCATETTYGAISPSGTGQDWWTIPALVSGTTYYFSYSPNGISDPNFQLYQGGSCPIPTAFLPTFDHTGCYHFTASSTARFWVKFQSGVGGATAYTWKLSTTAC